MILLLLATAVAALSFDLSHPLGVAGGIPYIILVLPGLWAKKYRHVLALCLFASSLNAAGYLYSLPGADLQVALINRLLAMFAIWAVAAAVIVVIREKKALQRQVDLDPLTKCFNRKYLVKTLGQMIRQSRRGSRPLSVIMLDIDHFKAVNDNHGHQAGDEVLCEVAAICAANIRNPDRVCRYGGEEFVVLLPDADQRVASEVAERIRAAIRAARFSRNPQLRMTASLGVAELTPEYCDPESLVGAADAALYQSKRAGRNQVTIEDTGQFQYQAS